MGRRIIEVRYRPAEGVAPAHLQRALTAAIEDQSRPPGQRDDETVDLQATAALIGLGILELVPGSVACRPAGDGDPSADGGLVLEFAVQAEDGAEPEAVETAARRFATAALQRRLGGRALVEADAVTLDLDQGRIDLTQPDTASTAGPTGD